MFWTLQGRNIWVPSTNHWLDGWLLESGGMKMSTIFLKLLSWADKIISSLPVLDYVKQDVFISLWPALT
jgi:hypothetical protein